MVSKASDDLPDPLNPVITVNVLRGISRSIFFRLCCRAPCTVMRSSKLLFSHSHRQPLTSFPCAAERCRNSRSALPRSGLKLLPNAHSRKTHSHLVAPPQRGSAGPNLLSRSRARPLPRVLLRES